MNKNVLDNLEWLFLAFGSGERGNLRCVPKEDDSSKANAVVYTTFSTEKVKDDTLKEHIW